MTSQTPITVALVEDNRELRNQLAEALRAYPDIRCVAVCANGEAALSEIPAAAPQVVFMDINLPGMGGVECTRELVQICPGVLVVMLTVYDNAEAIFASLESGACGYLHKPVRGRELVDAARDVVAGGSPMSAKIARMVVHAFQKPASRDIVSPTHADLTAKEKAVMQWLQEGFLYKEIAERMGISVHTVHFHLRHIYEKLQVRSRSQAVAKYTKK
ncbi:MAG: response regulator transcription factor [Kiritimatiellia bacterium]